jgi:hypothetical protein
MTAPTAKSRRQRPFAVSASDGSVRPGIRFGLTPEAPRRTLRGQLEYEIHF